MEIVVDSPTGVAELSLAVDNSTATIADVIELVTRTNAPAMAWVDGRAMITTTLVSEAGLANGSTIDIDPTSFVSAKARRTDDQVTIVQHAGRGSGRRIDLRPGRYHIGPATRAGAAELDEGPVRHAMIQLAFGPDRVVTVESATSARLDGVQIDEASIPWAGGILTTASRAFTLATDQPAERRRGQPLNGKVAFNRPPRSAAPPPFDPVEVPHGGKQAREARKFPLLAMLVPIPMAVLMAMVLGRWQFMLFGLMSPVMAAANWFEDRRTRKHELGASSAADQVATAEFEQRLADRRRDEVRRRRTQHPTIAEAIERAVTSSPRLWEVRPEHDDAFKIPVGLADIPFRPAIDRSGTSLASADAIVDSAGDLAGVPITVDLATERGVAFVGSRSTTVAACRALLVAAAVLHGPADVDVVVLANGDRPAAWEWVKWLPHTRLGGAPTVLADEAQVIAWCNSVSANWERPNRPQRPSHLTFIVVDDERWWRDRLAPLRPLLAEPAMPVRFLAMVADADDAPAVCTTLVAVDDEGVATVQRRSQGDDVSGVRSYLLDEQLATEVGRALAALDDPDVPAVDSSSVPSAVSIGEVLGFDAIDEIAPEHIVARWALAGVDGAPRTAIGIGPRGVIELDLVDDGPHGLIAGTTGAGKSELLRSLVLGLATALEPDHINFVLVDFKGGSAFDRCADLPHTVGLVTDLDEHLAGRVLRCLKAELTYREHVLRDVGASDLPAYRKLPGVAPLPRLVLVVDEFASVAAELPEFLPSLVDIAQRGRSLGIHMILATQRPAGVVDNKIKANTNLRIALRVQDDGDSMDVIDTRDAAKIPRGQAGRAYIRLGAGELSEVQTAYATGNSREVPDTAIDVDPFVLFRDLTPLESRLRARSGRALPSDDSADSDLDLLVSVIRAAAIATGQTHQRRPYPDPLPEQLRSEELPASADSPPGGVPFALVDLPDEQRQDVRYWVPGVDGSMLIYGIPGAGTSTALATLALGLASVYSADDAHLYVIDADANLLAPLESLPHCGAVIGPDDPERLGRLARHLSDEVTRRKSLSVKIGGPRAVQESEPKVVLMVDNVAALRAAASENRVVEAAWSSLEQVIRDGPALGLCAVLTATHERALSSALSSQFANRLVMRLGDTTAYTAFGIRKGDVPTFVPGRAVDPSDLTELQLAIAATSLAEAAPAWPSRRGHGERPVRSVNRLPTQVTVAEVTAASEHRPRGIAAAIGLSIATGDEALLELEWGENAVVAGGPGTGRSSLLVAIAEAVRAVAPDTPLFGVCPRGGPLNDVEWIDRPQTPPDVARWVDGIEASVGRRVVLIDDAERLGGPSFERLAKIRSDGLIVVVSGRADRLRDSAGWAKPLMRGRTGVLLRPSDQDGELVKTPLGLRLERFAAHRGLVINDGDVTAILAATVGVDSVAGEPGAVR